MEQEAQRCFRTEGRALQVSRAALSAQPDAIARRLVRLALRSQGGARDVSRVHIERSLAFLRTAQSGAALDLPGGLRWRAERAACRLERFPREPEPRC